MSEQEAATELLRNLAAATGWPPGIERPREKCPYCGRMIKPRYLYAYAKQPYRHKCPHGCWCSASKKKFWCRDDDRCPECAKERAQEAEEAKKPPLRDGEAAARTRTDRHRDQPKLVRRQTG